MKEQYLARVAKALSLPAPQRKAVLRDLEEIFASALEHGETEKMVIARLGPPGELAQKLEEPFSSLLLRRKRRLLLLTSVFLLAATLCLIPALAAQLSRPPANAIGYGDAATSLQLSSPLAFDLLPLMTAAGALFLLAAILCAGGYARKKGGR